MYTPMLMPQVTDDSAYAATPSAEQGLPLSLLQFLIPVATGGLFATFCSATKGGAKKARAQVPQGAMPFSFQGTCRVRPAERHHGSPRSVAPGHPWPPRH